jgi:hypothetical protein
VGEHVFVHSTNHKGAVAEAKIAAEAIALGIPVLKPIAEHGCYDLAFDLGSRVLRVQCKWGALQGDVISARIGRSRHTPRGYVVRTYSATEIDAFGIYCGISTEANSFPSMLRRSNTRCICGLRPPRTPSELHYTGQLITSSGL